MIESIIAEYMREHRRLVVPGLGAFLKKESGETVFVPFLNKDDGVLTGEVAKAYGISRAEAETVVSEYAAGISNGIDLYGTYLAAPLGTLKKDPNGILFLDPNDLSAVPVSDAPAIHKVQAERQVHAEPHPEPELPEEHSIIPEPPVKKQDVPESPVVKPHTPEFPAEKHVSAPIAKERTLLFEEMEEIRTVGNSVEAPKTFHDLLMEREEQQEKQKENIVPEAPSRPERPESEPVPVRKPETPRIQAQAQKRRSASASKSEKRGDLILILAILVAVIAIAAMIYAYAVIELPSLNLR